jgi:hypothetical protein
VPPGGRQSMIEAGKRQVLPQARNLVVHLAQEGEGGLSPENPLKNRCRAARRCREL